MEWLQRRAVESMASAIASPPSSDASLPACFEVRQQHQSMLDVTKSTAGDIQKSLKARGHKALAKEVAAAAHSAKTTKKKPAKK